MRNLCKLKRIYLGENHADVATLLKNIARTYNKLGIGTKAIEYHVQALAIRKTLNGENHNDVAETLKDIGDIYGILKEYKN